MLVTARNVTQERFVYMLCNMWLLLILVLLALPYKLFFFIGHRPALFPPGK